MFSPTQWVAWYSYLWIRIRIYKPAWIAFTNNMWYLYLAYLYNGPISDFCLQYILIVVIGLIKHKCNKIFFFLNQFMKNTLTYRKKTGAFILFCLRNTLMSLREKDSYVLYLKIVDNFLLLALCRWIYFVYIINVLHNPHFKEFYWTFSVQYKSN